MRRNVRFRNASAGGIPAGDLAVRSHTNQSARDRREASIADGDALREWASRNSIVDAFPGASAVVPELDKATL